MAKLENKVAIVTGAGQGIGKGIAFELAKEGAKIVVADINQESIHGVVKEVKKLSSESIGVKADVSNSAEVNEMVKTVMKQFGTVNILVNNAGIYPFKALTDITEADWDHVLEVNLKGCFTCTQAVLPAMIQQQGGKIINISSIGGAVIGDPNLAHYCASKGGVLGFTRAAALALAQYNINVNAIAPGNIKVPIYETVGEDIIKQIKQMIPLKRFGEPEDIAKAVVFLSSEDSSYITGQLLVIDGGRTIQ